MKSKSTIAFTGVALLVGASVVFASVQFIGVDARATLIANDTTAVVTGAIVCDVGDTYTINAVIQQNHGRVNVAGSGTTAPEICLGVPQAFSVNVQVVSPPNENFKKGPASLILSASTTGAGGFDNQTITARIHLTN